MTENKPFYIRLMPRWLSGRWGGIAVFFTFYILIYLGWLFFHWGGEENITLIGNLAYLPIDFISVVAASWVIKQQGISPRLRRMWIFLGLAFLSYFIADSIWTYLENVLAVQPFPSLADLFYLLFAPLATIGLILMPSTSFSKRERWLYLLDLLIIMITATMLMWYFIILPTAEVNAGDPLSQAIAVAYPIMDVVVIGGIVGALLRQPDRDTRSVLWILFLGMLLFVAADVIFAYTSLAGTYVTGTWIDAGWSLAQYLFMLAAIRQLYRVPAEDSPSRLMEKLDGSIHWLPAVAVSVGSIVAVGVSITAYTTQAGWLVGGALLVILLFMVRQFVNIQIASFQTRLAWSFVLLASLTLLIMLTGSFLYFRKNSREVFQQKLLDLVSLAALQQDGNTFQTISSVDDAEFERLRVQNLEIRRSSPDIIYVYTMRYDDQGLYFVVDAGEPGEENIAAYGDRYEDPSSTLAAAFRAMPGPIVEPDIYQDVYGSFLSAYAPILTDSGQIAGIIGVDIAADKIYAAERTFLLTNLGIFMIALPIIALLGWLMGKTLAAPIQEMARATGRISAGNLAYTPIKTTVPEIQLLDRSFSSMSRQLMELITNLEVRVTERTKALSSVAEVGTAASTILETDTLLQQVVNLTKERFGFYHAHIYLLNDAGDTLVLASGAGEPGRQMVAEGRSIPLDREQSLVARAAREKKGVTVNDVHQAPDFLPNPLLPETHSELAVPMIVGGKVIGVFDVQSDQIGRFTEADVDIQTTLAAQVAVALQNAHSFAEVERSSLASRLLNTMLTTSQAGSSLEEQLQISLDTIVTTSFLRQMPKGAIFLVDKDSKKLVLKANRGLAPQLLTICALVPFGRCHCGQAAATGLIQYSDCVDDRHENTYEGISPHGHYNVPIISEGRLLGVLVVYLEHGHQKSEWEMDLLQTLSGALASMIERKSLEEQTIQHARRQEAINLITQKIQSTATVEAALQITARELGHALGMKPTLVALDPSALAGDGKDKN